MLDFQQLTAVESLSLPVTIRSVGEDTLFLEDLVLDGPHSFALDDGTVDRILAPGSQTQLPVTYTALADEQASGALIGPVPIMTPSTPDVHAAFADAVTPPLIFNIPEQGLLYGMEAVTPPLAAPGGPNDGFLRPGAGLRVIYVSDEPDQSPDTVVNYVAAMHSVKVNPDHVILSGITGQATGCYSPNGNASPAVRYEQAIALTGGLSESICSSNWVNTLSNLAWLSSSWQDTFVLSAQPVEPTIEVELNHVPVYAGWYDDAVLNAVVFEPQYVPGTGDLIVIRYNLLGSCEG